jgi:hypothetical protein
MAACKGEPSQYNHLRKPAGCQSLPLAGLIKQELDDAGKAHFDSLVGMVEASIGRMVLVMTPQMQADNIFKGQCRGIQGITSRQGRFQR